jgi:hypothetical protein
MERMETDNAFSIRSHPFHPLSLNTPRPAWEEVGRDV